MKKIAIIGANGFVGNSIRRYIETLEGVELVCIVRGDDVSHKLQGVQYVIHAANPPSRFKAFQNPKVDYIECVEKTFNFSSMTKDIGAKFTLVSSISARTQLDHIYGINRSASELICLKDNSLVVRLGYMFSSQKIYGALSDLLCDRDVFLSEKSEYSYSDVEWNAKKIVDLTLSDAQGIYELGAKGSMSLREIKEKIGSKSIFKNNLVDLQIAENSFEDTPSIGDFEKYLKGLR